MRNYINISSSLPNSLFFRCLVVRCLVILIGASIALTSFAQHSLCEEIYVVNVQEVIAKSKAGSAVRKKVEKEADKRRVKVEGLQREVRDFEQKLGKQASLLSKSALQEKQDTLFQKKKELARVVQDEQEYLKLEGTKAVTKLVGKIQELLPDVVKDAGAEVVIERDPKVVLYVDEKYDLSDEIVERLNKSSISF